MSTRRNRYLKPAGAVARHGKVAGTGQGFVVNGDRTGRRIEGKNITNIAIAGGADRGVVIRTPTRGRVHQEPARLVLRAHIASDQVHLHRLVAHQVIARLDATVHLVVGTPVLGWQVGDNAADVGIGTTGVVLRRHHQHAHILEHAVVNSTLVLAHRHFVVVAIVSDRQHLGRPGQHGAGGGGPLGTGRHHGDAGADAVAPIVFFDTWIARQGNRVPEGKYRTLGVGPGHLGSRLDRVLKIDFVAVFPVVVVNVGVVGRDDDRDHRIHLRAHTGGDGG